MKKGKTLIIGIVILALLVGGYFVLLKFNQDKEAADMAEADAAVIHLTDMPADEIVQLSFTSSEGEQLTFEKQEDGTWLYPADQTFKVNADQMNTLAGYIDTLTAIRQLEDVDDLSEYGLDAPSNTITAVDADGKQVVIYVGSQNSATTDYYAYMDDPKVVSTIESTVATGFQGTLESLKAKEEDAETSDADGVTGIKGE